MGPAVHPPESASARAGGCAVLYFAKPWAALQGFVGEALAEPKPTEQGRGTPAAGAAQAGEVPLRGAAAASSFPKLRETFLAARELQMLELHGPGGAALCRRQGDKSVPLPEA